MARDFSRPLHPRARAATAPVRACAAALLLTAAALGSRTAAAQAQVSVHHARITEVCEGPKVEPDPELVALAQKVDSVLHEAVQDLGLSVDISRGASQTPATDERDPKEESDDWQVDARLERRRGRIWLRIGAVPPGSAISYQTSSEIGPEDVEIRVVVMLRDVMRAARGNTAPSTPAPSLPAAPAVTALPARSPGRPILALNSALLGGFVGYSLQRASGSSDERLTYPLVALGAGVGLGGSLLVSEEWDMGVGDAWFLAAGMWWPLLSGTLISASYDVPRSDQYVYGLLGTAGGITLAATALSFSHMSDGDAVLAHSGGALGTLLGGIVDAAIEGTTDRTPRRGMGYGAGAGVLLAGVLATQIEISPSRVLMIDLGASLGALTGAAAASPLLLVDESARNGDNRNRLWLASIAAGTLVGGTIGWLTTRPSPAVTTPTRTAARVLPALGPLPTLGETPLWGAGVRGAW